MLDLGLLRFKGGSYSSVRLWRAMRERGRVGRAKELWEKDGCKQGRDLDYWLQAENIVKSQVKTK